MSVISIIGIMLAVLVGIVLLCLGAVWLEKNFPSKKYDERQKAVQGRGYRLAFYVGVVYMLVMMPILVGQVDGEKNVDPYILVFVGFMLQWMVFNVYCLLNHAALPLSEKPMVMILGYLVLGGFNLISYLTTISRWPLSSVGYGTAGMTELLCMFFWFSMAFLHLIQLIRREKE